MKRLLVIALSIMICHCLYAQNVGIGNSTPMGKLHISGTDDTSQLVIDAHTLQNNTNPLLRFRDAGGQDILGLHTDGPYNVFLGLNAGRSNVADLVSGNGLYNTFIGSGSGYYNSSGFHNTAVGRNSFFQNTYGVGNTSIGYKSQFSNIGGNYNTSVGGESLLSNISGIHNTAVGFRSLYLNTTGTENTALGTYTLGQNSTAAGNVAVGHAALSFQSYNPGTYFISYNTAVGYGALEANQPTSVTNGINNTAVGALALHANRTGAFNTAVGFSALSLNSFGTENTAMGANALAYNTSGTANTAYGHGSLTRNTTGGGNTSIGIGSMAFSTGAYLNTAVGGYALYNNTTGSSNTAIGDHSMTSNVNGIRNTAVGITALRSNTSGSYNTALGNESLLSSVSGNNNTAIGNGALSQLTGGYQNIAIGWGSGTHAAAPNVYNTISIGNDGILNAYQNQAFIGNMSTIWIGGEVNWSTYSDERIKTNVTDEVKGLDFITRLRPVTYNKSFAAITSITGNAETENFPGKYDGENIRYSGFLAQEVEVAAMKSDYNFSGLHKPKGKLDLYSLSYAEFVVPIVKAIQEQQVMIDELRKEIAELKKYLEK